MGHYAVVQKDIWSKLRHLSVDARLAFLYLITSQHSNKVGCYEMPELYMAADHLWDLERVQHALRELVLAGKILYDPATRLVMVRRYLKHNVLANSNTVIGALKELRRLPYHEQTFRELYSAAEKWTTEPYHEPLREWLREQLGEPVREPNSHPKPSQAQEPDLVSTEAEAPPSRVPRRDPDAGGAAAASNDEASGAGAGEVAGGAAGSLRDSDKPSTDPDVRDTVLRDDTLWQIGDELGGGVVPNSDRGAIYDAAEQRFLTGEAKGGIPGAVKWQVKKWADQRQQAAAKPVPGSEATRVRDELPGRDRTRSPLADDPRGGPVSVSDVLRSRFADDAELGRRAEEWKKANPEEYEDLLRAATERRRAESPLNEASSARILAVGDVHTILTERLRAAAPGQATTAEVVEAAEYAGA